MATKPQVRGADRLTRTLGAAARDLTDLAPESLAAAEEIAEEAAQRAPSRTGRLRKSGRVGKRRIKGHTAATVYFGSGGVRYAWPIHFGVDSRIGMRGPHNIQPTPFLNDAMGAVRPTVTKHYAPSVQRTLNKIRGV